MPKLYRISLTVLYFCINNKCVNMSIRSLTNLLQKKAESELGEVPDRIIEDLAHIREWVLKESHLNIRTDDQWLVAFLRGCKFSLQRTKEKLDYFYTMRTLIPEFFANRDPFAPGIQKVLKAGALLPLPKTTDAVAPRIFLFRFDVLDPSKTTLIDLVKTYLMLLDVLMLEDDNSTVSGIIVWADFTNYPLNFLKQYTPSFIKKCILCIQSAYPLRIKGMYFTNALSVMETVFNITKSFLNQKLKSRLKIYSESHVNQFYNDIPQKFLTKRYGGDVDSLDELAVEWKNKLESYKDWFAEDAKYCSNESLRLGKPKTCADEFGVEGTFRKLAID